MFKKALLFVFAIFVANLATAQVKDLIKKAEEAKQTVLNGGGPLSQEEIASALKEALNLGVGSATDFLSVKDGYFKSAYKILLPDEAKKVTNKLKVIPAWSNLEADLTERMNRAAEDAATKAKPIFINAIKNMSIADAMTILMGNPDAATRYLEKTTYQALYNEFKPVIQASLDKVKAREFWKTAVNAYNKTMVGKEINPDLDDHVTKMALQGLFSLVEQKEKGIRADKNLRTSDLLKKVFAKQDKK